jgi:hypothetical protein
VPVAVHASGLPARLHVEQDPPYSSDSYRVNAPCRNASTNALKTGIVGLPNVGKSTLFNAIVKNGQAQAANFPFCTIEPNTGIVSVPDERLNVLAELSNTANVVPTSVEFVDIAGLVKGASKGEGLGNQFLASIRECDSIVQVCSIHCFHTLCCSTCMHASSSSRRCQGDVALPVMCHS